MKGFSTVTNRARSFRAWVSRRSLILALWGIFFSLGAPVQAATGDGSLTDSNITYVGRWDKSDSNRTTYRSYWGGAYLTTKFTGKTVQVKLASPTTIKVTIDGNASTQWNVSGTINLTPTPLASGTHTLQIATSWENVEMPFQGLVLDAGASTLAPDSRPLVEFIGDSITAGHSTTQGSVTDYAWLTGERLGAEHTQIAYSGITLTDGYHYEQNTNWPGMETMYFKFRPVNHCADTSCSNVPAWNFSNYAAKMVVVNLGTNDAFLGVGAGTFQDRYTAFLRNIRAQHPNADIFALRTFGNHYVAQTQAAVNARVSAGDTKVRFIDTTGWLDASTDFGPNDNVHPIDAGHVKIANRLAPILQPYMAGVTTVNDTQFNFDNTANWPYGGQTGAYQGDNHWSNIANAAYQVPFSGTQVKLYGARAPMHGIAAVSIDGGAETNVDTYAATRADGVMLWSSPVLAAGAHTLKVRVTGMKNVSATNTYIAADRVDFVKGEPNLLSNPGFENGLSGWAAWPAGGWQYAEAVRPNSGTFHLTHWSATPYQGTTYQTLSGLSNGPYTVKAWVRGTGGQVLYVKNFGGTQMSVNLEASDAYRQVVISNINVTNGYAEIGFWSNDAQGNRWLNVDDVTFYKQ